MVPLGAVIGRAPPGPSAANRVSSPALPGCLHTRRLGGIPPPPPMRRRAGRCELLCVHDRHARLIPVYPEIRVSWLNQTGHLDKDDKIGRGGVPRWQRSDGTIPRSSHEKRFVSRPSRATACPPPRRNLGINAHMLGRWKREFDTRAGAVFPGHGRIASDQAE
jgi:hypothetical protein